MQEKFVIDPQMLVPVNNMNSEINEPSFLRLPRFVMSLGLSCNSILLYCELYNTAFLSLANGAVDEEGFAYVFRSIESLAQALPIGTTAVKKSLKQLESLGLIRRSRRGCGRANHIYVLYLPRELCVDESAEKLGSADCKAREVVEAASPKQITETTPKDAMRPNTGRNATDNRTQYDHGMSQNQTRTRTHYDFIYGRNASANNNKYNNNKYSNKYLNNRREHTQRKTSYDIEELEAIDEFA